MAASRFAENTEVTAEKSRGEIERTLVRYGAEEFAYGWQSGRAVIQFTLDGLRVRFILPLPDKRERRFTHTPTGQLRAEATALKEWEQGCRQSWRALALVIKAKLEAVEAKIVTLTEEFAAHIMLPNGQSVGELIIPAITRSYSEGSMAPMLDAFGPSRLALES
jgi:hypothetical protein